MPEISWCNQSCIKDAVWKIYLYMYLFIFVKNNIVKCIIEKISKK